MGAGISNISGIKISCISISTMSINNHIDQDGFTVMTRRARDLLQFLAGLVSQETTVAIVFIRATIYKTRTNKI